MTGVGILTSLLHTILDMMAFTKLTGFCRELQRSAGALMVLRSLPQNAWHIFKLLANHQLDEVEDDGGK